MRLDKRSSEHKDNNNDTIIEIKKQKKSEKELNKMNH